MIQAAVLSEQKQTRATKKSSLPLFASVFKNVHQCKDLVDYFSFDAARTSSTNSAR